MRRRKKRTRKIKSKTSSPSAIRVDKTLTTIRRMLMRNQLQMLMTMMKMSIHKTRLSLSKCNSSKIRP